MIFRVNLEILTMDFAVVHIDWRLTRSQHHFGDCDIRELDRSTQCLLMFLIIQPQCHLVSCKDYIQPPLERLNDRIEYDAA